MSRLFDLPDIPHKAAPPMDAPVLHHGVVVPEAVAIGSSSSTESGEHGDPTTVALIGGGIACSVQATNLALLS